MNRAQRHHLNVAALSHAGMVGKNNEDRYAVSSYTTDENKLVVFAIVSDGIGGHRAGEVAAELAVNYIIEKISESNGRNPLEIMENAIHTASQVIASRSASKADQQGMGATCACVWVETDKLYTAYVGDSRIYMVRDGKIHRLTVDHTWVQEALEKGIILPEQARDHPNVHVIRRHLGSVELPQVDFRLRLTNEDDNETAEKNQGTQMLPGDIVLMCSDGLTDLVWDDEILRVITTRNSLKSAAEDLVAQANERGGHDNITVVLIGIPKEGIPEPQLQTQKKKGFLDGLFGE
ncbi:MAG TPA: protein phosphatase 2C domain-containing protein [Anaerolineales bacterium]|jgi:protein phosphatase|nr:protein phosphatase 2C domain-containing protein [Anaerolineales bacterium]